jgi:RNA-binding protein YhbY
MTQTEMQIGKNGLKEGTIEWLKNAFKKHDLVKISVLKSAGHDREHVREMSEKILNALGKNYTCRIVGFALIIRKWRKSKALK